jgi:signal transduction histidine kinase
MQETIILSIIITTVVCVLLLVAIVKLMNNYFKQKAEAQRNLYRAILTTQENERCIIAQNIHDEVGGLLTSLKLSVAGMNAVDVKSTKEDLEHIADVIDLAIVATKNASSNLAPPAISTYGLKGALSALEQRYAVTDINFSVSVDTNIALSEFMQINIYRMVSEAVNNSVKYAQPHRIRIHVYDESETKLVVAVSDDGTGFDYQAALLLNHKHGLKNIANRCAMLGAQLDVATAPGKGCIYTIRINTNA